ncbi:MAG: mitochondrial fission ELM1 family protein [Gammaproteobacteria bacterium]|nr:mitochondrial fission ELM1 family protein [Gammaproteobacteria bacterium]MBP6051159.1 mitochondrial fission ELM1 family protein [Pseudomonadales bacterium]MBK6584264.1 mitochondrial fission ELM1 family protein [Gammaproteobacteria bacterium]MBK7520447.1 mitochondrial fission ELM1 family protein [Gammaproteobacteria bacterium]MBK7728068.1 mitochondrial fission ELM1 family protein [Gammaproteobacteria bacterium]
MPSANDKPQPRVWVIGAYRAGEQSQLLALAEALGWPFEVKTLVHRWQGGLFNLFRGTGLFGIDRARSAALEAPWPDLVIAAGMRNEPVCRWIRRASGGRTRIVHIGRPWARACQFDLVITTPQYRLASDSRVLQNTLTLHAITRGRLEIALERHRERLRQLPSPHIAVIVGGPSGPYAFGVHAAARLALQASAMARALGGSLLISGSARTPRAVIETIRRIVDVPHELYQWKPQDPDNPYLAYLGCAAHIIVSFDSISMLSEACATRRPVHMFDLERDHGEGGGNAKTDHSIKSLAYRALMRFGPRRLGRDISLVHAQLVRDGRAVWLGEEFSHDIETRESDVARARMRVRSLLAQDATRG